MNKIILKIKFQSDRSFDLMFLHVDEKLIADDDKHLVYFNSKVCDFLVYSRKTAKVGGKSLRIPNKSNYKSDVKHFFEFVDEKVMLNWLKRLYKTLNEMNHTFPPFMSGVNYHNRLDKMLLNGEYWIL